MAHTTTCGTTATLRIPTDHVSTLYPVLRRLQADACLEGYDEQFEGRNRRYYKITNEGKAKLKFYQDGFYQFARGKAIPNQDVGVDLNDLD